MFFQVLDPNPWQTIAKCETLLESTIGDFSASSILVAAQHRAMERLCMMFPLEAEDAIFLSGWQGINNPRSLLDAVDLRDFRRR